MQAVLVMFKADGARTDFTIRPDKRYVIGRKDSCDLRLPVLDVSREHAAIFFDKEEDELVIEDLGSSNGTYVNNERVERAELCPGDVVFVGPVPLTVVIDGHPATVTPVSAPRPDKGGAATAGSTETKTAPATRPPTAHKPGVDPAKQGGSSSSASEVSNEASKPDEKGRTDSVDSFFGFNVDDEDA